MYSKKVMELFRNPKNCREMKNPDAVGKVGNMVCLLPEEKIHKNSENIEISKLEKNQKVLAHNGKYENIISNSSRNYNGKIIILKNKLGKISLTPEHLVFAIKKPDGDKFLRIKNKKKLIPAWYHTNDIKKGDIILYPITKEEKNIEHIKIDVQKPKWDFKSKSIPDKIPLNSDFLRLCGYFLSEGHVQDKPCRTFITFALHIQENDIIEDIKNISKKLFGLDIKIREFPEKKTSVVYINSARLARFFKKIFGNGAEHKKNPDFIMNLPAEKQKSLLYGLWKGDGYVNLNRLGPRAGYVTISYQLGQQIKTLLIKQKIVPSIYEEDEKETKGVKHKKAYRIHVGQRNSLKRLCDILKINYNPKSYESIGSWFDKNYLYTPITDKKIINYKGKVYNLEINKSHSFISEAFCLHNCGDIMHIYLKVENKNGKPFIKDISFKSLGCVANISTSSIVTELAKGKTLDEAAKITKDDVTKGLGGLPPVKIHCSVLAVDGLREAIYQYLKKEKLKIPDQIKKTHEMVEKNKETIEHKELPK